MDPQTASLEMMEKFWAEWFTALGKMQSQAAQTMGAAEPTEAAEVEDSGPRGPWPAGFPGMGASPFLTPDALRQFQAAFLQSLASYCEQYMRSPEFLAVMRRSMDNALTFRQQVNEFIDSAASAGFQPPGGRPPDQAVIVDAVRETERKLRDHIEQLADRLEQIEARLNGQRKDTT
ncbi:MAG: hypothetical protein ACYTGP_01190 [Planctomycetota bacterium]|jgi:hypothetical protein